MEARMEGKTQFDEETLYRVALTRTKGIGGVYTKKLIGIFGDARSVFRARESALSKIGIGAEAAAAIVRFDGQAALETELLLLERKGIRVLFFTDKDYPGRLRELSDAPPLLFYKGNADLNAKSIVAVVGTRIPSDYGREVTARLIGQMAQPGMLIVSGLALGIDRAAHEAALTHRLPTVGVLGHGFGHLYPVENRALAVEMLEEGGLLTPYSYSVKPEAYHFPDRNLIVAALCDALLVVETARKGGSLLTVQQAIRLNRKVFAVPGRIMDTRSSGCNWLIRQNKATLLTSGEQLPAALGWSWPEAGVGAQGTLLLGSLQPSSTGPASMSREDSILRLLKQQDSMTIDEVAIRTELPPSALALLLLRLELKGVISALPGKRYRVSQIGSQPKT
jgi:DNA processing protein